MANTTCIRCSRPLAQELVGELCETCRLRDTDRPPYVRAPGDTPYLPTPGADPDPVVLTRQFARPSGPPSAPAGYELRDTLGGGGMGVVVLAREAAADRLVALKFVRAAADPAARDRFRVEVRAMARLDHPHVVRVLAVELDRPDPFFAMEYVPGVGLDRRILAGGPLPPAEAARVMEQVARAVQHAHAHGVVHRDLKPGNVVVGPGGVAKVTDFGLAKRVDAADGLTVYDAVLGTPGFMAPEQTGGRNAEVGPAADVYGLGATLYALLTGEPPFRGADPVAVAVRVRAEPPRPPSQLRGGIPAGLEAVALRCLAKDPAGRYPSAGDVADDLARWRRGERTHARPPSRAVRLARAVYRRQPAAVMAALVPFVLLAISVMPVPVAPDPAVPARSALPPLDLAQKDLEANRGVVLIPPTGEPRFPAWMLSSSEFANMPAVNGACAYRSLGQSLLQLFPAPRAKKYLIGAEIKQLPYLYPDTAEPDAQTAALLPRVGIYIGCNSRATEKGHRTYSVLTLCYNDFLIEEHVKQGYDKAGVAVERDVIHQWLNGRITEAIRGMGHLPYKPGPGGVSPWRWLGAEVTPDGVTLLWRETPDAPTRTVAYLPVGEILRHDSELQDRIAKHPAIRGDQVGSWHPQLPLGIYCRNATVAVRNVTLKPVPE